MTTQTTTTHKLTPAQQAVMERLADGWVIVHRSVWGWDSKSWCEHKTSSEVEPMHTRTFESLCNHGLIRFSAERGTYASVWIATEVAQ